MSHNMLKPKNITLYTLAAFIVLYFLVIPLMILFIDSTKDTITFTMWVEGITDAGIGCGVIGGVIGTTKLMNKKLDGKDKSNVS